MDILRKINDFYYPYLVSREFLDYYFWFLNNNELSIEPYIFPINEIKIPKTQIKRFKNIKKIILLSATLGAPERFVVELGLFRNQIKLISDDDFKRDGIIIKMGEKLVLPIVESDLKEEHPINIEFINKSIKYIGKLATEFDKILILCWQMKEKEIIKNKLESKIKTKSSHKFFDFIRSNYNVIKDFSDAPNGYLLIANRYFGLDFPSESCNVCLITRLPTYLDNFDIVLNKFLRNYYFYNELQMRRITQSLGRINRGENDRSIYYMLDPRFYEAISQNKEFYPLLDNELKLILDFSIEKSNFGTFEDTVSLGKNFLEDKGNIKKDLENFLDKGSIKEDKTYEIEKDIILETYEKEVEGWKLLYENNYIEAIKCFENIIDKLNPKRKISEFLRKIEFYNYIIYKIYFKCEKKGVKSFVKELVTFEEKIKRSKELTWLNNISLFSAKDIKIQPVKKVKEISLTEDKFKKFCENPIFYLGDLYVLPEMKGSIDAIKEVLENLAVGHIKAPIRNLAVEFENICKKALKNRLPNVYNNLEKNKTLNISGILQALKANNYLRITKYNILFNESRSLRNLIIHILDDISDYAKSVNSCEELKDGIRILLKEIYFSDMLRRADKLIKDIGIVGEFKFVSPENLKDKILKRWCKEKLEFDPKIDNSSEITSYSGTLKIISEGQEHTFNINLRI